MSQGLSCPLKSSCRLLLSAPPKILEGSNNRFYAHRPMVSPPSNRPPGPLVDWWPSPFSQQVIHEIRPQIRDLQLCIYVGAVAQVCSVWF